MRFALFVSLYCMYICLTVFFFFWILFFLLCPICSLFFVSDLVLKASWKMEQSKLMIWIQIYTIYLYKVNAFNCQTSKHRCYLPLNIPNIRCVISALSFSFFPLLPPSPLCLCVSIAVGWWWGVVKHFSSFLIVLTCAIGIPIRPHWFPTAKCIDFYISHWSPLLNLPTHTLCVCLSLSLHEHHAGQAWTCVCVWASVCEWKTERERGR